MSACTTEFPTNFSCMMVGFSEGFGSFLRSLEWRSKEPLFRFLGVPFEPFGLLINPCRPLYEPSSELVKGGRVAPVSLFFNACLGLSEIFYWKSSLSIGNNLGLNSVLDWNFFKSTDRTGVCWGSSTNVFFNLVCCICSFFVCSNSSTSVCSIYLRFIR